MKTALGKSNSTISILDRKSDNKKLHIYNYFTASFSR